MPPIVRDLFLSKKFLVALFTAISAFAAYRGWNVDPMTILLMASPFLVYIGAQGWADSGKEKAKVDAASAIQIHAMTLRSPLWAAASAAQGVDKPTTPTTPTIATIAKDPEAGFAKVHTMLLTAVFSVFAGMFLYAPATVVGGCAHPRQSALRFGQCVLDDGVLGEVLAVLGRPDYLDQVGAVSLRHAVGLVDCALQALAAPAPGLTEVHALEAQPEPDTIARRARETIASRRASVD